VELQGAGQVGPLAAVGVVPGGGQRGQLPDGVNVAGPAVPQLGQPRDIGVAVQAGPGRGGGAAGCGGVPPPPAAPAARSRTRSPGRLGSQDRPVTIPSRGTHPAGPQRAAFPLGQPAPDAINDPVADGVVQARSADRAPRADLPRGPGRFAPAGEEQLEVSAAACRQLPPAPASAQQNALEQQRCGAAAGGPSPRGRDDPRPPGGGESGQAGHLQAAGRELVGEPPRVAAGGLAGALAHHGVRQRPRRSRDAGPSPGKPPAAARAARRSGSPPALPHRVGRVPAVAG
jgi:hypothetical protein